MSLLDANTREEWEAVLDMHLNQKLTTNEHVKVKPTEVFGDNDNNHDDNDDDDGDAGFDSPSKEALRRLKAASKSRKRLSSSQIGVDQKVKRKLFSEEGVIGVPKECSGMKHSTECLAHKETAVKNQSTGLASPEVIDVNEAIENGTDLTRRLKSCVDRLGEHYTV